MLFLAVWCKVDTVPLLRLLPSLLLLLLQGALNGKDVAMEITCGVLAVQQETVSHFFDGCSPHLDLLMRL